MNKPNHSKCQMRNRMCMDINDWCGEPPWYPLDIIPPRLTTRCLKLQCHMKVKLIIL